MTATGLQQFLGVNLDASRTVLTDISIHSEDPSMGIIEAQELLEPSVETVVKVSEDTLIGEHRGSLISFKFAGADSWVTCRRDSSDGIVCDRGFTVQQ
jgi:hypothetical protein|tara:strand:+ start:373 stop:666 length:294 start_codon:yes stop_codon:yes gene_type:complete